MNLMDLMGVQAAQAGGGLGSLPQATRTGLLLYGLGDVFKGGGGTNAITMGSAFLGNQEADKKKREEQEARAQAGSLLSGMFGGGPTGQTAGGFNPSAPISMPTEADMIGSEAMATLGTSTFKPGDRESFVKAMMPHAMRVSEKTGLDPRLVIAQAAQETGWGKSAPNNNFFGIKSHGREGGARLSTQENMNGQNVTIQDSFRQYGDIGQSADDYAAFLQQNPRYKEMLSAQGLDAQVDALGRSGYATDPNYAQSVGSIARSIGGQDTRTAQAGGTQTDAIDPARAIAILNSPYVDSAVKGVIADRLKKQMEGGAASGKDRFMNVDGVLYDVTGPQPVPVTERQAATSAAQQQVDRIKQAYGVDDRTAVGIADGVLRVSRDPFTDQIQVTNLATNEVFSPSLAGQGQQQAGQATPAQAADGGELTFGQPYQGASQAFGLGGMARRGANVVSDFVAGQPVFPETAQTQQDFAVLREDLTQDIQSAYGQKVPSWALQAIRDLTPAAGSIEGAGAAQAKLTALGRKLEQELQSVEGSLQGGRARVMSREAMAEAQSQASGLRKALGKVQSAMQGFQPPEIQLRPEVEDRLKAYQ